MECESCSFREFPRGVYIQPKTGKMIYGFGLPRCTNYKALREYTDKTAMFIDTGCYLVNREDNCEHHNFDLGALLVTLWRKVFQSKSLRFIA